MHTFALGVLFLSPDRDDTLVEDPQPVDFKNQKAKYKFMLVYCPGVKVEGT